MQPNENIFDKISSEYYQLTASEKKVADYISAHKNETQYMSISQLAESCSVAEATVSRFCRRLGYKGYSMFKLAVASSAVSLSGPDPDRLIEQSDTIPELCRKLYALDCDAIVQTMEMIRPADISTACDFMQNADKVLCMGQGGSMIMANEAAHLFSTAMPGFLPVYDSHLQTIAAATLSPRDAVLFFSYSGSTRELVDTLAIAREQKAKIILVTHFFKSPASAFADVILRCGSNEGPLQPGSIPARMAQLFIVDLLFAELCRRRGQEGAEVRKRVAAALATKHI